MAIGTVWVKPSLYTAGGEPGFYERGVVSHAVWTFSSPEPMIPFGQHQGSRAGSNTGRPRFMDSLSNLAKLFGWIYKTITLLMLKKLIVGAERSLCWPEWQCELPLWVQGGRGWYTRKSWKCELSNKTLHFRHFQLPMAGGGGGCNPLNPLPRPTSALQPLYCILNV